MDALGYQPSLSSCAYAISLFRGFTGSKYAKVRIAVPHIIPARSRSMLFPVIFNILLLIFYSIPEVWYHSGNRFTSPSPLRSEAPFHNIQIKQMIILQHSVFQKPGTIFRPVIKITFAILISIDCNNRVFLSVLVQEGKIR